MRPVEFAHRIFTDPDFPKQAAHRCRPFGFCEWLVHASSHDLQRCMPSPGAHRASMRCKRSRHCVGGAGHAARPLPQRDGCPAQGASRILGVSGRVQPLFNDLCLSIFFAVCSSQLCLTSATTIVSRGCLSCPRSQPQYSFFSLVSLSFGASHRSTCGCMQVPPVHSVDLSTPHKVVLVYIFKVRPSHFPACGLCCSSPSRRAHVD
jgi:hypothetical protein